MPQLSPIVIAIALGLASFSSAQYPPPISYDNVLKSPANHNITISYKSPDASTCMTTFSDQKQYTGYVNLPPSTLEPAYRQNYSINTFFWFIESRVDPETAPLTIWLNGGPGASSLHGLFNGVGPCEVIQLPDGSYSTQSNPWGWDRSSNLLFIDQPTQTGFSFDALVNKTLDPWLYKSYPSVESYLNWGYPLPQSILLNGTFSTGLGYNTQNTSMIAARAAWHFLQGFLSAFPQYNPGNSPDDTKTSKAGINLFAESYGGIYGPTFVDYFESQNAKRLTGEIPLTPTLEIEIRTLGIVNGFIDPAIQTPWWPMFAYDKNTYGLKTIDQTTQLNALNEFEKVGGCREWLGHCQTRAIFEDPEDEGDEPGTNAICMEARVQCDRIFAMSLSSGRSPYDIRAMNPDSFPPSAFVEYLNTASVQQSIGAPLNFTFLSRGVFASLMETGDEARGGEISSLAYLLDKGIRVAFIYGDADIICNWRGGEEVSLALAENVPSYELDFPHAGYADIIVNNTYVGGQVRQFANLSFARIYDSGHSVAAYQPETAFTVFTRIITGADIAMGRKVSFTYSTKGSVLSMHRNEVTEPHEHVCWARDPTWFCTSDEQMAIARGEGIVRNGVWYAHEDDYQPPTAPLASTTTTATVPLTGVYTAPATPRPRASSSAASLGSRFRIQRRQNRLVGSKQHGMRPKPRPKKPAGKSKPPKRRSYKTALIATAATLGSLLLLSLLASLLLAAELLRPRRRTEIVSERENIREVEAGRSRAAPFMSRWRNQASPAAAAAGSAAAARAPPGPPPHAPAPPAPATNVPAPPPPAPAPPAMLAPPPPPPPPAAPAPAVGADVAVHT